MLQYVGWLANTVLFAICCFLLADTANALIEAWLMQSPAVVAGDAPSAAVRRQNWDERQIIVQRNLFHSSALSRAPAEPVIVSDVLEETQLPLKLWGTIASENAKLAWASVEELDARETTAVRVGDNIKSAEVVAIERRRIVLLEKGVRRALSLDDEDPKGLGKSTGRNSIRASRARRRAPSRPPRPRRSARASINKQVKKLAEDRFEVPRDEVRKAMSDPTSLFSQAKILPKVGDDGKIVGYEVNAIEADSVFEQFGIEDGDVITQIGGMPITDVTQSGKLMSALATGEDVTLTVLGADGTEQNMTIQAPQ